MSKISRRDFLKLLGIGSAALAIGGMGGLLNLGDYQYRPIVQPVSAQGGQNAGSWSLGANTTIAAVHAVLLHNGKILYGLGSSWANNRQFGPFYAYVLDPSTGSEKELIQNEDLFCSGHTTLANGNIIIAGGTLHYDIHPNNCNGRFHGLNSTYVFDVGSETLNQVSPMAHGRWYPTLVTLPNGKLLCCGGLDEYGIQNQLVETYDPNSQSWTITPDPASTRQYCVGQGYEATCAGAGSPCYTQVMVTMGYYPRMHVLPSGRVPVVGFQTAMRAFNPANGTWAWLGNNSVYRHYGTSFLLPLQNTTSEKGKIIIIGGSPDGPDFATTSVEMIDFRTTTPTITQIAPLTYRRKYLQPVILPNGKCVVFGGSERHWNLPTNIPEMFDPQTQTWQVLPSASIDRVYHSVALLLPDGRVWLAGSTKGQNVWELRTELFSPDYLSNGTRPTISATPNVGDYGQKITIPTPDAANIASVSLVRPLNSTHHYDPNQRLLWLQITSSTLNALTVSAPLNANLAPPGYYMLFILNSSGVPSVAKFIKVPGSGSGDTTPPSQVIGLAVTSAGSSGLDLSWTANPPADEVTNYTLYRGTTPGFIVTPGTTAPIATPVSNSYSDTGLTASTTYYYSVAAVDAAGNIGTLSSEASGTTAEAPETTPPSQVIGLAVTTPSGTSTQLNLTWTANTEADLNHYNVYRGTSTGFVVTPGTTAPIATTTNSYSDTGLTASTTYYYKVTAVDNANNIGPLSAESSGTTGPDMTVPTVSFTSPANNATVPAGDVLISGTSADNVGGSGVMRVEVRVDSEAYNIATPQAPGNWSRWTITHNIIAIGSHTLRARVRDFAGNLNQRARTINVV